MAAEMLAKNGHSVTIYDQIASPARKFLIAGRGGLNITHSEPLQQFIPRYGDAAHWLTPCIEAFPPYVLIEWVEGLGQETFIGSSGRVFPKSMKATHLLRAWLKRLDALNVHYAPKHIWRGWQGDALIFSHHDNIVLVKPDITILALGGASWAKLGSDGTWVNILAAKGIEIAPLVPSNCGFTTQWTPHFSEKFAGHPIKSITLTHNGICKHGEMIITKNGIEGGAVYALSSALRKNIESFSNANVTLDLRPNTPKATLSDKIQSVMNKNARKTSLSTLLAKCGFSPLAVNLLRETFNKDQLTHARALDLAQYLKAIPLTLIGTSHIDRAISSAGGIMHHEIDENFMLRKIPNTYAIGEMLDWEAPTGGYLLQACFSMGAWVGEVI